MRYECQFAQITACRDTIDLRETKDKVDERAAAGLLPAAKASPVVWHFAELN